MTPSRGDSVVACAVVTGDVASVVRSLHSLDLTKWFHVALNLAEVS